MNKTNFKRTTIRIHEQLEKDVSSFCEKHCLSRDSVIENLFSIFLTDAAFREEVLKEAGKRNALRRSRTPYVTSE